MAAEGADRGFCEKFVVWDQHYVLAKASGSEGTYKQRMAGVLVEFEDVVAAAPSDLQPDLIAVRQQLVDYSIGAFDPRPEAAAAADRITMWVKTNCGGYDAGAN